MRVCLDTEFLEYRGNVELISIGVVREDGAEFYRVSADFNQARAKLHDFVGRYVWPKLPLRTVHTSGAPFQVLNYDDPAVRPRPVIARELAAFLLEPGTPVETWAWFSAHDHVAWTGLFDRMADLPEGLPWHTRDIEDWRIRLGRPDLPQMDETTAHHALVDARHHWTQVRFLEQLERDRHDARRADIGKLMHEWLGGVYSDPAFIADRVDELLDRHAAVAR